MGRVKDLSHSGVYCRETSMRFSLVDPIWLPAYTNILLPRGPRSARSGHTSRIIKHKAEIGLPKKRPRAIKHSGSRQCVCGLGF
jgi:hypothetical protein